MVGGEVVEGEVVEGEVVEGEADRKDENRTSGTYGPIFLRVMIFSTTA